VAIVNGYITLAELKTYLGLSGSGQDDNLENAVEGACREIDAICGRFFYQTSSEIKYFTPISGTYLEIPDLSSTSGLEVKIDTTDNGTHDTTLTINTDFYLKPLDAGNEVEGVEYQPYTRIFILDTRSSERFNPDIVKSVKVTGLWGFNGKPNAIKQATFIQSARLFKRKDAPFSSYGGQNTGTLNVERNFDPDAMELIKGYRKNSL
tara:strand:+ start:254 stop:874 length:621 start_codon:yes stop_codon:yes gene_type:complete